MAPARPAIDKEQLAAFCRRNQLRRLSLFGSVLRDDFHDDSDIGMLAEFEPDAHVGPIRMAGMGADLTEMLGRTVDSRTAQDLSPYFRDDVVRSAVVQYAA